MKVKSFLAAFDFDHTIVDDNSDLVVRQFMQTVPDWLDNIRINHGWTSYMNEIFRLLHIQRVTECQIRKAITAIRPVQNAVQMLRTLKKMDCEVIIISDANSVYIDEWLKAYKVKDCVDKVYTNPAEFKDGRLHIQGYHQQDWCKLSAKNMCKGYLLFEYISERQKNGTLFRYVCYAGDGRNDFCPAAKLREDDFIFPRKYFCLEELLEKSSSVKAKVIPWTDTSTILETLQTLSSNK